MSLGICWGMDAHRVHKRKKSWVFHQDLWRSLREEERGRRGHSRCFATSRGGIIRIEEKSPIHLSPSRRLAGKSPADRMLNHHPQLHQRGPRGRVPNCTYWRKKGVAALLTGHLGSLGLGDFLCPSPTLPSLLQPGCSTTVSSCIRGPQRHSPYLYPLKQE